MAAADAEATDSLSTIPENISISYLPDHKTLGERILKRGLNYYSQGFVHSVKIFPENTGVKIVARCWRSMRKNESPHRLHIDLSFDRPDEIVQSYCTCKVGLTGHCSHVIGLIKTLQGFKLHGINHVPAQMSCTSMPQQWHVPRGDKIQPVPINHVVVAKPIEKRKRKPVVCHLDTNIKLPAVTENNIKQLKMASGTPLEYLISPDRPTITTKLGSVQIGSYLSYHSRNLKSTQPVNSHGCGDLSVNKMAPIKLPLRFQALNHGFNVSDPDKLEECTRLQSNCKEWFDARQRRLTASTFGEILNRKSQPTEKMLSRLFQTTTVHAASLTYGKRNEGKAKAKYMEQYPDRHIHECGFVVNNEFAFLGATPDGKLCHNGKVGIMEIKCPFSAKDMTIQNACNVVKDFCLHEDSESKISLNRDHQYYAQVQGQLMITGCEFCEFIVFCPNETALFVERILPDIIYMERMLNTLSMFYEQSAKPYLTSNTALK